MREVVESECFEVVFNLFTSFGYFEDDLENHKVLKSVHQMLNENGILVIDFMNCEKVIKNLVLEEKKTIDNIDFLFRVDLMVHILLRRLIFQIMEKNIHFLKKLEPLNL